jgi:hypothetical protein
MKTLFKIFIQKFHRQVDIFFSFLIIPAAYFLLLYRRIGSSTLPKTTLQLKKIGVFPIRNHYYEPLFDDRLISIPLNQDRNLPGIDFNISSQLALLHKLTYSNELVSLELTKPPTCAESFCIHNGSFESGDAEFLYQLIRHFKPKNVLEIGSGQSTKIARIALQKNQQETNSTYKHICIEPYEQAWLEDLKDISLIRDLIEDCNLDWSKELVAGDLLFVDSSHVIRPQGDVLKEYLEIFPKLNPGVIVHVHDIFTPKDYLKSWIVDDVKFWNEQYLLEALLSNTDRYEVVAALNLLKHGYYNALEHVCPYLSKNREPGSFYFRVKL